MQKIQADKSDEIDSNILKFKQSGLIKLNKNNNRIFKSLSIQFSLSSIEIFKSFRNQVWLNNNKSDKIQF